MEPAFRMPPIKSLLVALALPLLSAAAPAAPVKPAQIDAELGQALGFQIYRFEAQLGDDEVMVIHEISTLLATKLESEYAMVNSGAKASYQIVLVDSGAFHPSLRGTYMLRSPGGENHLKGVWLTATSKSETAVEFEFSVLDTNTRQQTRKWSASVEKFDEVAKRWPGLTRPKKGQCYSSRRIVSQS